MSFKNDYKKEMDNIKTDGYLKQKVLKRIEAEENKKVQKPFPFFRIAAALVACAVVAVAVALPRLGNNFGIGTSNESEIYSEDFAWVEEDSPAKNLSYEEIYKKINELINENGSAIIPRDDAIELYTTDGAAMPAEGETATDVKGSLQGNSDSESKEYSNTTTQVAGVDEADIVKTDGKYIYNLSEKSKKIFIVKAGVKPEKVSEINIKNLDFWASDKNMYLSGDRLVVFGTGYNNGTEGNNYVTRAYIYDISNPAKPENITVCSQSGNHTDSRLIGDKLYLISNYGIYKNNIVISEPATYVPKINAGDYNGAIGAENIYVNAVCNSPVYTVICGYDITDGKLCGSQSVLGLTQGVYCNTKNIITAGYADGENTHIVRYTIDDGKIDLKAEGKIKGTLLNQFSIDEYNGYFRFVTTYNYGEETRDFADSGSSGLVKYELHTANALYVLNGDLKQVGAIENLATDERVYSVRFMGDVAYFVTFRQTDPLFSVDLKNPKNPKIIGSLKIPGFSNYLFPYGEGMLFGIGQDADEISGAAGNVKLSMFNISNPADVTEDAKTILDVSYSDALYSHKNILVDTNKNIIGFSAYGNENREYLIFSFENGKFVKKARFIIDEFKNTVKGLYIGNEFYIVTDDSILVYNISDYKLISELELN